MPEYRRAYIKGGTYFFTVNSFQRRQILTNDIIRKALKEGILHVQGRFPFKIEAWVLLPDHLHCIWSLPHNDANYSARWGMIKRYVGSRVRHTHQSAFSSHAGPLSKSRSSRKETFIWQRRFWEHQIRNERDFARHVDYIHWNPVKHGHVKKVSDWPYSTFHRYVEKGIYSIDWCGYNDDSDGMDFGE